MYGLDTNVLLRYLIGDDAKQADQAAGFIEDTCTVDDPCFLNRVVLCEAVWVFEDAYGYTKRQIVATLDAVMRTREFHVEDHDDALAALAAYRAGKADFADLLIGETNARAGCERTATFDRKALSSPRFTPVR